MGLHKLGSVAWAFLQTLVLIEVLPSHPRFDQSFVAAGIKAFEIAIGDADRLNMHSLRFW